VEIDVFNHSDVDFKIKAGDPISLLFCSVIEQVELQRVEVFIRIIYLFLYIFFYY
jgi:hypothetical protein